MDKNNKNRTDLLAAGRKKLQQFRQNKDGGKGTSKSSGKGTSKSEPQESKQHIPVGELHSAAGFLGSSEMLSRETSKATEIDAQTLDLSSISVAEQGSGLTHCNEYSVEATTAEVPIQEVVVGDEGPGLTTHGNEYSVAERIAPVVNDCMATVPSSEPSDILIAKAESIDVGVPVLVESLAPLHSVKSSDAVDLTSARGENQEADTCGLEQVYGSNLMVLDEKSGVDAASAQEDRRMVREKEPTSEPDLNRGSKDILNSSLDNGITSGDEVRPYSLSQLAKVVQSLGEDEFRFVVMGREFASSSQFENTDRLRLQGNGSSDDILEGFKEQLYLTDLEKHMFHLQLSEQLESQREMDCRLLQLVDELSSVKLSLKEVQGKNEYLAYELDSCRSELELVACGKVELQEQIRSSKMELDDFFAQTGELQSELERSKLELSSVAKDLVDCRSLVEALQVKNESLNGNLTSQAKEMEKLKEEKGEIGLEKEKLSMELVECKASLEYSRAENVNSSEINERSKSEAERQSFFLENNKLLAELASWKDLGESLRVENANINEILTSVSEDRSKLEEAREHSVQETRKLSEELIGYKNLVETLRAELSILNGSLGLVTEERNRLLEENDCLKAEKDNVLIELANCKLSSTDLQVEYSKAVDDLKQTALRLENLVVENATLTSSLDMYKAKLREIDNRQVGSFLYEEGDELSKMSSFEREGLVDVDNVVGMGDRRVVSSSSEKTSSYDPFIKSSFNHHKWDVSNDSPEFITLKERLDQVEEIIQNIEEAIERMYSHSSSLSKSGGKTVSPAVSKLIQAFESKAHIDDEESEEVPLIEIQPHSDAFMHTNEQIRHMREVLKELSLDAENASKLFKGERDGRMLSDTGLIELRVSHETLEERSNILEEANIELVVLYEVIKQHLCTIEAKKRELLVPYEDSKKQYLSLKAKNSELERKLCGYDSRIGELQFKLEEQYQRSDDTASSINHQMGVLTDDVSERVLLLEKELNSTVSDVVEAIRKLDSSIGSPYSSLAGHSSGSLDIGSHVATSVEAATTLIKNLKGNLEAAYQDHQSLLVSYKDLTEKFNDLHEKDVLYAEVLSKIYGRLEKLIGDSSCIEEESQTEALNDKLLIPLYLSNYDILMERLAKLLGDRLQLESFNSKLNSELLDKAKDIEELRKSCLDSGIIQKMVEDIEGVIKLDGVKISTTEPVSSLMSLIHFLIRNYEDQVSLSKEILVSKEMKMIELQGQIDHLYFLTVTYKNESLIFMECLRTAVEDLVAIKSERQQKISDLEQSEQRVSSLREKLSIAVTKGKGLIVQRDGLKQSLASTSSELEKCMHELQLKDARLHEIETKLKTYSEAGERVEALESELSYIRNSATALRESFLLKDSVLQRVEEILEDLELPEHFHAKDIIEKIDWLARSVTETSLPPNDWDQKSSAGGGSYSDSSFGVGDLQPTSVLGDDLRRKFDELQSKFYGLAEQNEMLEQSLMERNSLVKRWEEILDKINIPLQLRSMEPVDRIEWLRGALSEAHEHCDSLQQKIDNMENYCGTLTDDLEDSQRRLADMESALESVTREREQLSATLRNNSEESQRRLADMKATLMSVTREKEHLNATLTNDLEDSQRRLADMEATLMSVTREKEHLNGTLTYDLEESQRRLADMEATLMSVTREKEHLNATLTNDLEESQRRLADMEATLMSVTREKEHLTATLTNDLEDAQRRLADMEATLMSVTKEKEHLTATLTNDLEDSQRRLADMEVALKSVTKEREHLSASMENLSQDYESVSGRATSFEKMNVKLQTEVNALQEKLNGKLLNEENKDHVHSEIKRLQDFVKEVLQDPDTEELDLSSSSTEYLERLLWKLTEKYRNISLTQQILNDTVEEQFHVESNKRQLDHHEVQDIVVLKKELDEALGNLTLVTEERDRHLESNKSLVREAEALEIRRQELQELLAQEEQKTASVKERLNIAVRKGKSLVQQRDSLKQNIYELTTEVERLKSVIEIRENAIIEYEQKINSAESEILFVRNCLAETDRELQEKTQTLSRMISVLMEINIGSEPLRDIRDPVEKMEHVGKSWRDLHEAIASSQLDSSKSKRAAELLLAELNEVQERNDGLQEELSKSARELTELSKERELEEAAKCEALSRLEHYSALQSQERNKQFSQLMVLKSVVDQLRADFIEINKLVTDVLPKELELLHNLEASFNSLKSSDAFNIADQALGSVSSGLVSHISENEGKIMPRESSLGSMKEQSSDDTVSQLWSYVEHHLEDFTIKVTALKEKLHTHSVSIHEQAICLPEAWKVLHREMVGQKHSFESIKADITRLESIEKEKCAENLVLRRNISVLYEACKSSVMEIEKGKAMLAEDATVVNLRYDFGSSLSIDGGDLFSGHTLPFSEECIRTMSNGLLSVVKEIHCLQGEIVEATQMEMKTTISNLQKELREKDNQKDRICLELVNQIRESEASATGYMEELELAKNQIHDLQGQVNAREQQYNTLQQRIHELEEQEVTSVDLQERAISLTDALAAKEQEIEALMQALDEEEAQMEDMKNKIDEQERLILQKELDLENAEASRGKAIKKLSITVNKFNELHQLSATLLSEVEKLQSQLQERDTEISFLRQEVTRCTEDAILTSKKSNKGNFDELWDLLTWLDSLISGMDELDVHHVDRKSNHVLEYKERIQKQITVIISEWKDLKEVAHSRDNLLQLERNRLHELQRRGESLEESLREKESQLSLLRGLNTSGHRLSMDSEITEVEPVINKWAVKGTSVAPQVRSLRKINNDQVAIAIDTDLDSGEQLEDEDDDKAHGFKSLTTSKIVPRFTRPVSDLVDGLWVSCDRALMRQPALRLGVILYWAVLHGLLAVFVV